MPELTNERTTPRLTSLSHGGGCGCKLAPAVLEQIIARAGASASIPPQLLVGIETSDDAAVYQINEDQAIVATTDFFMPIVDDPFDFGAIAATNAISDVYAMGGRPLFALAVVAMPIDKLPLDTIRRILEGGESACQRAGIPVAGGHSVDSVEPIYGLVAIGLVDPRHVKRNAAPGGRQDHSRQGAGRRRLRRRAQEAADDRRAVQGDAREHHATQHAGHAPGRDCRACTRSPTSPASVCWGTCWKCAEGPAFARRATGARAAVPRRAEAGGGRARHRRLYPKLEELR